MSEPCAVCGWTLGHAPLCASTRDATPKPSVLWEPSLSDAWDASRRTAGEPRRVARAGGRDASKADPGDASRPRGPGALCWWCEEPIPYNRRKDAETCSKGCRQARNRFRVAGAPPSDGRHLRLAYADPPYPRKARRYYRMPEVDHAALIAQLCQDYPEGWALSTSAEALEDVLALARTIAGPNRVRLGIWVRGARVVKSRRALNAWEPVVLYGGRIKASAEVDGELVDVLIGGGRQRSHPGALVGMKPAAFWEWLFRLLGARQGDSFTENFPGSGAGARAWELYLSGKPSTLPSRLEGARAKLQEATCQTPETPSRPRKRPDSTAASRPPSRRRPPSPPSGY